MIYDIFVYSYSRVHVNGFWEIIITFLFYFLILIYFFYFWYYVSYPYYACEIRFKNDQNLLGWKKTPNECHEFFLSSDGGKCSAISRSQGTSVPQTKRSWTNDDVLVKMLCKRMRSWTLNFNLNNSILVSFDINLSVAVFCFATFSNDFSSTIQGPKWRKTALTWKITKFTRQLNQDKTRYI